MSPSNDNAIFFIVYTKTFAASHLINESNEWKCLIFVYSLINFCGFTIEFVDIDMCIFRFNSNLLQQSFCLHQMPPPNNDTYRPPPYLIYKFISSDLDYIGPNPNLMHTHKHIPSNVFIRLNNGITVRDTVFAFPKVRCYRFGFPSNWRDIFITSCDDWNKTKCDTSFTI